MVDKTGKRSSSSVKRDRRARELGQAVEILVHPELPVVASEVVEQVEAEVEQNVDAAAVEVKDLVEIVAAIGSDRIRMIRAKRKPMIPMLPN